eukprot:4557698-Amphidinium_carterae.1
MDKRFGKNCARMLKQNLECEVMLTSSYSGWGTEFAAIPWVLEAAHAEGRLCSYSATECDEQCRAVLMGMDERTSPKHVFGDVCERCPPSVLQAMKDLLATFIGRAQFGESEDVLNAQFVSGVCQICDAATFDMEPHAYCYVHEKECPVYPPRDARAQHWEVAGTTCVAHSAMGSRKQWLHVSSIPYFCWLYSIKSRQPQVVIHENSPLFPETAFNSFASAYAINSVLISPTDMGFPFRRQRRYTTLVCHDLNIHVMYNQKNFERVTSCTLTLAADVYMLASDVMLRNQRDAVATLKDLPTSQEWSDVALLDHGSRERLYAYLRAEHCMARLEESGVLVWNLAQNVSYAGLGDSVVPSLLTRSL